MSTKEKIYSLIDTFPETQLGGILSILEDLHKVISEAEDDAYCSRLYDDYKAANPTDEELTDITELAAELGIALQ